MEKAKDSTRTGLRSPFEDDELLLVQIGRAVSVWGVINNLLRTVTGDLLGCSSDVADIVLNRFSGEEAKLKFIQSLLIAKGQGQSDLYRCLQRLVRLCHERNLIVHGGPIWGQMGDHPPGYGIVNFKDKAGPGRTREAGKFIERHLCKVRLRGGQLFDLVWH